jgi:hypothetical protein
MTVPNEYIVKCTNVMHSGLDAAGNIYVVGATNSLGRYDSDVFVRKFNPSGSQLLYETYLDSNGTDDVGYGIAVDSVGNAYVTGKFGDWWFRQGQGALVAKLSPTGVPLYQVTFGADSASGYSGDIGRGIAVDAAGNAYVVGKTFAPLEQSFPTTEGTFQQTFGGGSTDAFVVKLNPSGEVVYSTLLGGAEDDTGFSIALDTLGHAYVTGETNSGTDFPTTEGALQRTFGGESDVFITKLNPTGSAPIYSTFLGGNGADTGRGIALDAARNILLTGMTEEVAMTVNNFPVVNAFQTTYGGSGDSSAWSNASVAKLNSAGSALIYSSYMGGAGSVLRDEGHDIVADEAGNAYLTGSTKTFPDIFTGIGFPIVNAFQPMRGGGVADAFVTKLTPQGALVYSSYLGGNNDEAGSAIALSPVGVVYVTGTTASQDFPVLNAFQPTPGGGSNCDTFFGECYDAFITKIADNLTLIVNKSGTGSGTASSAPAGISCGADCTENYENGTVVTLTATAATGSTFAGWSGDPDCTDGVVTMNASKTCIATFNLLPPLTFTLTITKVGTGSGTVTASGINCGADCSESYTNGTVVTLTAIPAAGSTFANWTGDPDCTDGSVTMNANKTCTAMFDVIPPSSPITILTPNGGEAWPLRTRQLITWNGDSLNGKVKIEVSYDGGQLWTTVIKSTRNDGVHPWRVKGVPTTQARIRVSSVINPTVFDVSDRKFTIQ